MMQSAAQKLIIGLLAAILLVGGFALWKFWPRKPDFAAWEKRYLVADRIDKCGMALKVKQLAIENDADQLTRSIWSGRVLNCELDAELARQRF